jgi:tRNA threonylcarbamoyladenosine biosynthesis protein TsaE
MDAKVKVEFNKKDISEVAKILVEKISGIKKNKAKVVTFSGDLGSGKTTLTKEIGIILGIKENIISPTFVIMKIYKIDEKSKYFSNFKKLIHIDAYRLNSGDDLLKIGWKEICSDKENLIILEWPEIVESALDKDVFFVKLGHINDETRSINF